MDHDEVIAFFQLWISVHVLPSKKFGLMVHEGLRNTDRTA